MSFVRGLRSKSPLKRNLTTRDATGLPTVRPTAWTNNNSVESANHVLKQEITDNGGSDYNFI